MTELPKRKLNLKIETLRPLQADELDLVNGAKSSESIIQSAAGSAASSAAVSALAAESLSACPIIGAGVSAVVGGVSQWLGCY